MIDINLLLDWGATYKKYKSGEIIFKEDGICNFYHQLIEGSVRWVNINEDGKEFIQTMIDTGECFGELPLFDDQAYAATAIANTHSVVLRLHKSTFLHLIKERPDIHLQFSKLLTQRVRYDFLVLKHLAQNDPEQRISSLLCYFKETGKNICAQCGQLKLTRQQIADMTGLRVETVIRAMRHMHEKGKLVIKKGKVYYSGKLSGDMISVIQEQ